VYLTRATSSAGQPGDNQAALDACNRVISSALYQLLPVYSDVFDVTKENGAEHIFSVQFDLPPHIGNITIQMQYPNESALVGGGGAGSFKVNPKFVNSYDAADVRKNWNVSNMAGTKTLSNYFFYKYRDPQRQGNNSRANWPVLRYADVLLMQSEALNNLNPADASKFSGINAVRSRAGLTPLDFTTTPTADDFVTALVQERGWELCLEGHRRYDLIRLGRLKAVQKTIYNRDLDDKYLLFPIPDTEMALNPNLNPNNPGF
jgi:starch-binding outer membrane protein, SusD/RagB family